MGRHLEVWIQHLVVCRDRRWVLMTSKAAESFSMVCAWDMLAIWRSIKATALQGWKYDIPEVHHYLSGVDAEASGVMG